MNDPYGDLLAQPSVATGAAGGDPYGALLGIDNQQQRFKATLNLAVGVPPAQAAQQRNLAKQLQTPVAAVEALPDDAKRAAAIQTIDQNTLNAPVLRRKYTDADFAKLAHDDSGVLSSIEGVLGHAGDASEYIARSTHSGLLSLLGAGAKVLEAVTPMLSEEDAAVLFKDDPAKLQDMLQNSPTTFLSRFARAMQQGSQTAMEAMSQSAKDRYSSLKYATTDTSNAAYLSPVKMVGDAVQSLPTTAALALTVYLTRGAATQAEASALASGLSPEVAKQAGLQAAQQTMARVGALSEGAAGYAQQYNQTREDADTKDATKSPMYKQLLAEGYAPEAAATLVKTHTATQAGQISGLVDAAVNYLGGPVLGKIIGEGGAVVPAALKGFGTEGLEEFVQSGGEQFGQNWATKLNLDPNQDLSQDVVENMLQGLFVGGLTGSTMSGVSAAVQRHQDERIKQLQAQHFGETLQALMGTAANSNLRTNAPDEFAATVQQMADETGGAPSQVYADARLLSEAFAQSGLSEQQLARAMPNTVQALREALAQNGTVAIPVGELLATAPGTPLEQSLLPILRQSEDGLSLSEAEDAGKQAGEFVKNEAARVMQQATERQAFEQSADAVRTTILDQLNQVGRFRPEANAVYADMVRAFYATLAQRTGVTPEELYSKYPLRVAAEGSGQLAQGALTEDEYIARINPTGKRLTASERPTIYAGGIEGAMPPDAKPVSGAVWAKVDGQDVGFMSPLSDSETDLSVAQEFQGQGIGALLSYEYRRADPFAQSGGFTEAGERTARAAFRRMRETGALEQTGTRATFSPEQMLIVLGQNADLSSFLHESGHFFLEVLADLGTQPGAPEQIAKDWATTLEWFGVAPEQWAAMTLDQKRPYHERWAESVEQYFFEGKAPSVELRGVFDRFRTWLTSVYKSLKRFLAMRELTPGGQAAAPGELNQPAYHGTPHRGIKKFSTDKIGTGEGAQAYGWGLYFASKREIAEHYREKLGGGAGQVYEADIPEDSDMLLWDKPLSEQPEKVREELPFIGFERTGRKYDWKPSLTMGDAYRQIARDFADTYVVAELTTVRRGKSDGTVAPEQTYTPDTRMGFYETAKQAKAAAMRKLDPGLATADDDWAAHHFNRQQRNEGYFKVQKLGADGGERAASEALRAAGVKGIKYLDGTSRADGEGSYNYVVFSGDDVAVKNQFYQSDTPAAGPLGLSDEVRQVMDRLLATDEQIAEMERVRQYGLLFKSPEEAGMTPEQWAKYISDDEKAHAEALSELSKKSLKNLGIVMRKRMRALREVQADMAEKRKAVEAEAAAIIAKEPVYQAMRWLKKGEMVTPDGEEIKVTDGFKLDRAAVDAIFPESMPGRPDMSKLRGMTLKSGGLDPSIVSDMFGFRDAAHLITSVIEAFPQADQVQGLTDQMMLERYGDAATPRGMERAADEAVHNENRGRVLAIEMSAINAANNVRAPGTGTRTVNAMVEAAKQFSANLVSRKLIKDLKPTAHTAAETRAAKAAEKALAKGDTAGVIQAKRDQLLNFYAARATNDARIEAAKIVAFFEKVATVKDDVVGKTRDIDVVKAAQAVLAAYGVGTKGKAAAEYMATLERNDPAMFAAVKPSLEAALINAKPIDELTVADLKALNEEVQALWYLAKRSRQMEIDGNLLDRQDIEDDLKARMQVIGIPETMPGDTSAITPAEQRALKLKGYLATARRAESWARSLDGSKGLGPFTRYVWQPVKEAANAYRADKAKYLKAYRDLLNPIASTLTKRQIEAPELGYTFGEDTDGVAMVEILHAILHTGNESNKRKLLLGRTIKKGPDTGQKWATENADGTLDTKRWDAFVRRLTNEGILQPAHFDFAQGVWDLLEQMKPLAQKAHRDVFGRYFAEVTADEFVDPFGVKRRGGYAPAQADARIVDDAATRALAEAENASMQFAFPTTSKGFTKGRVEYNRPLLLDLRALSQHIDKVLLFSYMEQPVRDVRKVLTAKGVAYGLNRIDPAAFDSVLTPWLNRAAKQLVATPAPNSWQGWPFWTTLRNRAGMAAMFGNVANAVQQFAGFSLAAVRVKPSHLMGATAQYIASPKKAAEAVASKSEYMNGRLENEVANMNDAINEILINPNVLQKTQRFTAKHAYFLQSGIDNVMGPIIWTGAYNQALAEGLEDRDAVRKADAAVRETQGATAPEDISAFEEGTPFSRLFTQFAGYFNMQANLLGTEFQTLAREMGLRKGVGRGLYVLTFGFLVNAWVAEAIMQLFKGGPDDDDKDGEYLDDWLKQVFGWSLFRNATAMIPVAGQLVNSTVNATNDKPYDDRMATSPAISMLESAAKAPTNVYKAIVEDGKVSRAVKDVGTLIALTVGIPVGPITKPLSYAADVEQGKVSPTGPGDAARGAITGSPSGPSKNR